MLIDWFTVAAQVVNFLILVWLLKRYLYQPILHAIDEREQRIAAELADATAKQAQAKTERDTYQDKNTKFDQERDQLLQQVKDNADVERERLLTQTQQAGEALRLKHQKIMARDAENIKKMLSRKTSDEVFAIARKTLSDLATTNLEQQVTQVFIRRLSELKPSAKTALEKALNKTSEPALLSSAFDLSETDRTSIHTAIKKTFGADIDLKFTVSKDLISGIELKANGQKLVWNIADYLLSLEQEVTKLLQKNSKTVDQEPLTKKTKASTKKIPKDKVTGKIKSLAAVEKHHE
tara:strand:+ start:32882 stop:33760 length:879 start_codon:yes stop_codon:yes gene_type:complete